jgi:hypothetical protein
MKAPRKEQFAWIGTAESNDIRVIALTPNRPTPNTFVIGSLSFHRIPLRRLDDLYKQTKRFFLPQPPRPARPRTGRRSLRKNLT